ncbi:tetratricopeptide repeat protein [Nocardia sp. CDC159]|uniref:Tetratricopeptide repeat protein n=1 Tax=Nocardia pulmonis TaxID=2951408 RepID=A0A9X2J0Z6_9NOCA|nr:MULTISPECIES: tetratricopeptide repeat protein [Nocardia]MCM6777565.1 tetratricopeptide repeat protein [Nocardia pulmonis]MCM6790328.1 tetratricopeptide repeat protein [Nocardia sp. CDC159]
MGRAPLPGGSDSARKVFSDRLSQLFEAAGKPTLEQVVRTTTQRMRAAQGRGGRQAVTAQRISDWRSGRNLPHTFESAAPVLVTLIDLAKARPGRVREDLVDHRMWERLWTAAAAEPSGGSRPAATKSLPRDVDTLVGREEQLRRIVRAAESERIVSIHAIDGMPGVGKTALAIRAAHELAPKFPDGQYFVHLHAHTPGQPVADPSEVLAGLLTDLGIDPRSLPDTLAARRNLWRDRLADKRILLVLDDAHSPAQIEPLLPAGSGCVTVVTSRRRLVALNGATPLALGVLDPDAAVHLFVALAHRTITGDTGQSAADRAAAERIVELCGYLPLAIVLLAGRLAHHPAWSITDLDEMFSATSDRLAELETSDRAVRAAFDLSYRDLPDERQVVFRLLGLHPGTEFDQWAVAAVADIPLETARRHLEALYNDHLLDETSLGRYRLHDLLREYAGNLAASTAASDNAVAMDRLLDYYQHTAAQADRWLARRTRPSADDIGPPVEVSRGVAVQSFGSQPRALAWMRAERENLLACLEYNADRNPARMIASTEVVAGLLDRDGPWPLAERLHRRAADIARHHGDRLGEANALTNLGVVRQYTGDYKRATDLYQQALNRYRDLGSRRGEANALSGLGVVCYLTGDYEPVADLFQQALTHYRDLGDRRGEANTLNHLGLTRRVAGDYGQATDLFQQALARYRDLGDRRGEATALSSLGFTRWATGDYGPAADLFQQALTHHRDLGDRRGEATALADLGLVRQCVGDYGQAGDLFQQALTYYRELGDRRGEADTLCNLGQARRETGAYDQAADLLQQSLTANREIGNRHNQADALGNLGILYERTGDHERAADLHQQALALYRDVGSRHGESEELNGIGRVRLAIGEPGEGSTAFTEALGLAREVGVQLEEARALDGRARCRAALGDIRSAVTDLRAAVVIYENLGVPEAESAATYLATLEERTAEARAET